MYSNQRKSRGEFDMMINDIIKLVLVSFACIVILIIIFAIIKGWW